MANITKEDLVLNDKVKFDNKGGAILGVLEGPVADFMHSTRNGRKYSEDLWEKVFQNPIVKEQFENGGIVGELDHPADRDDICTEKVAVIMPEPPVKKNGEYYGKFNILDTPCGRIVHTLAKAGFRLGVSSRGTGDVDEYTDEVDPDTYDFTCFDVVLLPAVKTARVNLVTESLDSKKVNYKTLLKESLDKATDQEKQIMKETLKDLNISLDEEMKEEKCVICGETIEGYGNNAEPVKSGKCCDKCNTTVVIPERLKKLGLREGYKLQIKGPNDTDYRDPNQSGDADHINIDKDIWNNIETSNKPVEWECDGWSCKVFKEDFDDDSVDMDIDLAVSEQPEVETDAVVDSETEEEPACEECEEQIKDLLHKFLDKYDVELEESEDMEEIEKDFIELFHETIKPHECDPEMETDIKITEVEPEEEIEAGDAGSFEILEQLQNTLKENKTLKEQVKALQDEKAVSDTKVGKLTEDLTTFKAIAANAGKKALNVKSLENENKLLAEKVTSLEESLAKEVEKSGLQESRISKLVESKKVLEQKLDISTSDSKEIKKLRESISTVKSEADIRLTEANKRNDQLKKLVEKYKGLAHDIANRYIESKALSLGITANEIKNRLNESYTLDDVDAVCEDLQKYSLNISQLPFAFDKPGNARMRIRENRSKDPLKEIDSEYDDTVDDYLLELAGLKK